MQVALHEADRDVCRFLWKESGKDEPMKAYRLTRPYLAVQMIRLRTDTRLRTLAIRFVWGCMGQCSDRTEQY
ncbi:hypothetical protein T03_8476 [Trichinella britovi]|uniref:Uncharacterized protein n=1 Tax=Trichinella britovi TaxID=45882 RepID=A0A0V1CDE4_TRIBR|nr:hypothetical protein T03_8476 [Trichinella britovi]